MLAKNTIIHIHPRYNKKDKRMCTISVQVNESELRRCNPALSNMDAIGKWVQHLVDIATQELTADHARNDFPCAYSEEEAKELTLQRGREIKDGRVKLIPHEEVMNDMEQLCTILSGNID